jgi:hypothetical protein
VSGVIRDEKGRLVRGSGNLNPGGRLKWAKRVRNLLAGGCEDTAKFLVRVVTGEEKEMGEDGERVDAKLKDRIAAAKIIFEYALPKPKQSVEVTSQPSPLAGIDRETLLKWARDD